MIKQRVTQKQFNALLRWLASLCGLLCITSCSSLVEHKPLTAEQLADCRKIWIRTIPANHSSIVFRVKDIPSEYMQTTPRELTPAEDQFIDFGIYDRGYIEQGKGRYRALLPSPAGMWINLFDASPEVLFPWYDFIPIVVSKDQLQVLIDYVYSNIQRNEAGDVIILPDIQGFAVQAVRPYHAFNTCHSWVIEGLDQAGYHHIPPIMYNWEDMYWSLNEQFPRSEQVCTGYLNISAEQELRNSRIAIKK